VTSGQSLPISVCLIAGNEAHRIRRTLESVAGWTSEIIVVLNDDVNDGTDQIAETFGAKVFREPWQGHIAQKNSAAEKTSGDWLFSLDADEVVSPELREEIHDLFSSPEKLAPFNSFSLPRCSFYLGRWIRYGDWYPDRKIRLWRRQVGTWGGANPHDELLVQGAVGRLHADLLHYSMDSLNHHVRKSIAYSDTFALQQTECGRDVGTLQLWFRPCWRFVRSYFLRLGFLDGWQGYVIARMVAFETFLRYAKVRAAQAQPPDVAPRKVS